LPTVAISLSFIYLLIYLSLALCSYEDELVWAALWLYEATGEARYLAEAGAFNQEFGLSSSRDEVSWDNKAIPVQVLLAKSAAANGALAAAKTYTQSVVSFCDYQAPGQCYTGKGGLCVLL